MTDGFRAATFTLSTPAVLTRLERLLRAAMVLLACAALGTLLYVTLSRIGYPFELEWMEGASVDTAARILDGQPLYAPSSSDWVSPLYGPLYYGVSAGAMQVLGPGFLPLRLVSWLSTLVCLLLLYRWVARESGSRTSAFIAAGLFAATFAISESWFDLARVDMLFVCLQFAGLYLLRFAERPPALAGAGILLGLAFLTKQTALIAIVPFALYALLAHRWRALWVLVPLVLVAGGISLAFELTSSGWYSAFVFGLGNQDSIVIERLITFWSQDVQPTAIALAAAVGFVAWKAQRGGRREAAFYALLLLTQVGAAYLARLRAGGAPNVLIPMHLTLALMLALALGAAEKLPGLNLQALRIGVVAACCVQFAALAYLPYYELPDAADQRAGEAFIALLEAQPGEVLVIAHGHYAAMAGRAGSRIGWSMNVVGAGDDDGAFVASMRADIARQRWSAIVVDWAVFLNEPYQQVLDEYYEGEPIAFETEDAFVPVTGMETRPLLLYRPRPRP